MSAVPAVRDDAASGLLVIDWPNPRPAEFPITAEVFEALIVMVNIERRVTAQIATAALRAADLWDADQVDDDKMGNLIAELRQALEEAGHG